MGVPRSQVIKNEGYFRTGDVKFCDEETGLSYHVEWKKEVTKVCRFQVAPGCEEGTIIGVHKGDAEEMSKAYVVRKKGGEGKDLDILEVKK